MTGEHDRADPRSSTFPLPDSLTLAGRRAFDGAVRDYAARLTEQLDRQARQQHRPSAVYTTQDVRDAQYAYEQRLREQIEDGVVDGRGIVIALLLIAAGLGVLAAHTTGVGQALLLGLVVGAEAAGLVLVWRSRPGPPTD